MEFEEIKSGADIFKGKGMGKGVINAGLAEEKPNITKEELWKGKEENPKSGSVKNVV